MEVKHFKLISTISRVGSLTKAADELFLTQSALSHQLKEIERLLETKIFNRVNRRLIFTDSGRTFLESANHILDEIEKVQRNIKNGTKGESGSIRVATECNTYFHWLARTLKAYQNDFPNIDVKIGADQIRLPTELLLAGEVDFAIVHGRVHEKGVEYHELFTDEIVALVAAGHRLSDKPYLTPEDFARETYITHSPKLTESIFYEKFLKPHSVAPPKVSYYQLTEAVIDMVSENLGIAAMAQWLATPYVDPGKVTMIKLSRAGLKAKWYLATLKENRRSAFKSDFLHHVVKSILAKSD
ncbi:MAG TPA: LysR family transcriptional regulator [Cyclobacteriaceae bacterium]|nr:LysR family transcriptional regulator [Cyclobacteriaceae bacterium]